MAQFNRNVIRVSTGANANGAFGPSALPAVAFLEFVTAIPISLPLRVNLSGTRLTVQRNGRAARNIDFGPGSNLSLQQVASATGYSRNQISYLLNQVLGQSFYRYVNQARLQHLLERLQAGNDLRPMDELAFEAGFNSLTAFYSTFRRHTGMTPKAYLKDLYARARTQDNA